MADHDGIPGRQAPAAAAPVQTAQPASRPFGARPPSPPPLPTGGGAPPPPPTPPQPPTWDEKVGAWAGARPWPVVLFVGLFILAGGAWWARACETSPALDVVVPLLALVWVALLFAWFVACFTGDAFENRTRAIEFAYFFMVLSFGVVAVMIADIGKASKFGVIEGCIESFDATVSPIRCDYPIAAPRTGEAAVTAAATTPKGGNTPADKAGAPAKDATPPAGKDAAPAGKDAAVAKGETPAGKGDAAADKAAGAPAEPPTSEKGERKRYSAPTNDELRVIYLANKNYHYLLNIGGRLEELKPQTRVRCAECTPGQTEVRADCGECRPAVYAVRGGLPVPVYFILLALIGGAISLAKNVPGLQKRSDLGWQGTAAEPRLAPGEVRELLLFQVLQFVSAPLLAVAAFHAIKPESFGTTVVLGFIVGFGSDQIIAAIRNMTKGAQAGGAQATPLTSSVSGSVTQAKVPVVNATVALVGTTLTARTDAKGEFSLIAVPVRNDPYTLKASAADKAKEVTVSVKDPAPVKDVKIDLA